MVIILYLNYTQLKKLHRNYEKSGKYTSNNNIYEHLICKWFFFFNLYETF